MKNVKVIGPGCVKCKTTYNNVLEALKETGIDANVEKIEDIEEMMKYNILSTPVLMIDEDKYESLRNAFDPYTANKYMFNKKKKKNYSTITPRED